MIRQLAPIISRFQSRADRSNLVPFVVDSSRSAVRPRIYRSNITERRPALGYRQPESPVREREMFVTCRARYVRRTLARPRTRPQRREVRGCWLLLPAGKPNFYVSVVKTKEKNFYVSRARPHLVWPRETARRRPAAARGVVGQGEGTMRASRVGRRTRVS